mgnify:CR=1 FL=1
MKKTMIFLLGLFLLTGFVLADNHMDENMEESMDEDVKPVVTSTGVIKQTRGPVMDDNMTDNKTKTGPVITMNGTQVHAGLYNALENVENENARAALTRNMERFLAKYQERLQNYENVTIEVDEDSQEMTVVGKRDVKYLGFINGKAKEKLEIKKNGEVNENKPWYRFMYAEQN